MKKSLLVLIAVIFVLGCSGVKHVSGVLAEENETLIQLEMNGAIPEHNISFNITYPMIYENPIWSSMPIKFYIDNETSQDISWFSQNVIDYTRKGILEWENATKGIISFEEVQNPDEADIIIYWSQDMGGSGESGIKIGEAAPARFVKTGYYSILFGGKITQIPYFTSCVNKVIATHEIGHMLGLDHSTNPKSIMYPYAWCYQTITPDIVDALEKLYSIPMNENYDLTIINASATKHGKYVDGELWITNNGAAETPATKLSVVINGAVSYDFDVKQLPAGMTSFLQFNNVLSENEFSSVTLELNKDRNFNEIFYDNNAVVLS